MFSSDDEVHRLSIGPGLSGAALGRAFVRKALDGCGNEISSADAVLLASELVSNALLHTDGGCDIAVGCAPDSGVRVEIGDHSSVLPTFSDPSQQLFGGHGLHLVERLATAWGIEPTTFGKVVWYEIAW